MDPNAQLLVYAERALDGTTKKKNGDAYSPAEVDAIILRETQGAFRNISELRQGTPEGLEEPGMGTEPETSPEEAAAYARINARGGNAITDFAKQALHGGMFGTSDEMRGGLFEVGDGLSALTGGSYTEGRDRARQEIADNRLVNRSGSMAAEALGGMFIPGAGGAKIGQAVTQATGRRAAGAIVGGGTAGGIGGALLGAGEAEGGLGERLAGALVTGTVGGLTGAGLGGLGSMAARVAERIPGVRRLVGGDASDSQAYNNLRRAMDETGLELTPEQYAPAVAELGPNAVLVDLSPKSLAREAKGAANRAPRLTQPGGPIDRIAGRDAEKGVRIARDIRTATGLWETLPQGLKSADLNLQAIQKEFYTPLDTEYAGVLGDNVRALFDDPIIAEAIEALMKRTSSPWSRVAGGAAAGGSTTARSVGFKEVQALYRRLGDDASKLVNPVGVPLYDQRLVLAAKERLGDAMKVDYPLFGPAQVNYAQGIARRDSHAVGEKMWKATPEEILNHLNTLPTDEAKDAFRLGMLSRYERSLYEKAGGGAEVGNLIQAGPEQFARQRLRLLADTDEGFDTLIKSLDTENRFAMTNRAIQGNSTSAEQLMTMGNQIPANARETLNRIVDSIAGLTTKETKKAAELLGQVLLSDGQEAAELMANHIQLTTSFKFSSELIYGLAGAAGSRAGSLFDSGN